jgi:hypothetical protein
MQSSIWSRRAALKPIITSPQAVMTGTERAPFVTRSISLNASRSSVTSKDLKGMPFCERYSFAIVQYGQVGVV